MPELEQATFEGPWRVAGDTAGGRRFGALLKNLRERSGMSPQQLAEQAEVHVSFVRGIERGAQAPSVATARPLLACMQEQDRIRWRDQGPPDLLIRDPKTGGDVAFEFKAKTKGQNRRAEADPLVGIRAGLITLAEAMQQVAPADVNLLEGPRAGLMAFAEAMQRVVPAVTGAGEPRTSADRAAGDDRPRGSTPAGDAAFGRVVRLLATADEETLGRIESLLRGEPEPGQPDS